MPPPSNMALLPLIVQLIIVAPPPEIPPPELPVLPRIVLLIAVSDPALYTPPPQPLPATVFSLMVVFWIVNVPPSLEMPPPKGGRNPTINAWLLFTVELTIVMVPTL